MDFGAPKIPKILNFEMNSPIELRISTCRNPRFGRLNVHSTLTKSKISIALTALTSESCVNYCRLVHKDRVISTEKYNFSGLLIIESKKTENTKVTNFLYDNRKYV